MDAAFDKNKSELAVSVLSVLLKMLAHADGLLDEVVEVLRKLRGKT